MCFDLETGKVVLRHTISRLRIPERVIKINNYWGKPHKNAGFKNNLEFWDCMKNKYDWDNGDLDVSDGKFEVEPVGAYPHVPAEIPGVPMESDLQPGEGAVQANPIPKLSYLAEAARANAGLAPATGVSENTGVEQPTHNVVYLTDADDDDEDLSGEVVHKV